MLDANVLTRVRIRPASNVAGGEDVRCARPKKGVDEYTAIDGQAGSLRQRGPRADTDAGDHKIRLDHAAALQIDVPALDRRRGVPEVKDDAVLLVQGADVVTKLRAEHPFERSLLRCNDVDIDAAIPEGCGHLEPDEARSHHHGALRACGERDNRLAIGQRTQGADVRLVSARDRQTDRLGPRGKEQPVVGQLASIGEGHFVGSDVDAGHPGLQSKIDLVPGIEARRPQRYVFLGRIAGEVVL